MERGDGPSTLDATVDPHGPSDRPLEPGDVLHGKYKIVREIGAGGMGKVYEAKHLQLGTRVALKLPLGRTVRGEARLLREARVAASLDSEHVARIFDVDLLEDGTPFMVLEYLEGESLGDRLAAGGSVPVDEAVSLAIEVCDALVEAHERGIVHRDVKPSNLFSERRRDGTARLRVLDFGIASIRAAAAADAPGDSSTLTDAGAPVGSPPYMAPEQLRGSTDIDGRADLWSLGITLYQLLAGRLPFAGSGSALVAAILTEEPARLEVPPRLGAIIRRCLSKEREKRPASARALRADLTAFLAEHKTTKRAAPRGLLVIGAVVATLIAGYVVITRDGEHDLQKRATTPAASPSVSIAPEPLAASGSRDASAPAAASGESAAQTVARPLTSVASTSEISMTTSHLPPPAAATSHVGAPSARPTSVSSPAPNCHPPYTVDADGIRHAKPECM